MNITLNKITIENFKGIQSFTADTGGRSAVITGANGTGKTSVYDGFLWLLFGKDSTGRKDFQIRPLDDSNQPVKGPTVAVEAEIEIDGNAIAIKKTNVENIVKRQLRGYTTECWVNDVPKKVTEYGKYIDSVISEDTFKLLADLHHFNRNLHWSERRKILMDMAGDIGTPDGCDELLNELNGRSIEEFKTVLSHRKKALTKQRDEINPRIDELAKGLGELGKQDTKQLSKQRKQLNDELQRLRDKRNELVADEKQRLIKTEQISGLKTKLAERKSYLKTDTGGIESLLEERRQITAQSDQLRESVEQVRKAVVTKESEIETVRDVTLARLHSRLATVRNDYIAAKATSESHTCYACGQTLPADKLATIEVDRKRRLNEMKAEGDKIHGQIKEVNGQIEAMQAELKTLNEQMEKFRVARHEYAAESKKRLAEIEEAINNRPSIPPEQDEVCCELTAEIEKLESQLGRPLHEQIEAIDAEVARIDQQLNEINTALAQSDRAQRDKARIKELEADEKRISQQIADTDKLLDDIDQYKAAESAMIEQAVNEKFRIVKFKLFNQLLNGSLEDTCEAMLEGVPYNDLSTGQKIIVGIDIINALSKHYGISCVLFIDNAESLTFPIDRDSQVVQLVAIEKAPNLQVKTHKPQEIAV